jgi:prevent-host-death family protein
MSVAIRELKASLSRVLSRAQDGEVIEVTSHNKPIARIVGIPLHAEDGLRGLIANGNLSWSGGKPRLRPPLRMVVRGTPVSQMVLEDRR